MGFYTTVTESITHYTGLSPAAFFTILALMVVVYKLVCGMFVAADAYIEVKREQSIAMREPVQLGDVTEEELRVYDGSDPNKPLLMAIKGNVYDVSRSRTWIELLKKSMHILSMMCALVGCFGGVSDFWGSVYSSLAILAPDACI